MYIAFHVVLASFYILSTEGLLLTCLYRSDQVSSVDECGWNYSVPWYPCCTGWVLHTDERSRITVYLSCCKGQVLSAGKHVLKDMICHGAVVRVGYSLGSIVLDKLCSVHACC